MVKAAKWDIYIHGNRSEGDCQLVSLANACTYLTGRIVSMIEYEGLIKKCGCVAGSCIDTKPARKEFGLGRKKWKHLPSGRSVLPLEINVWHKFFGFHSILAVDWESRTRSFRVTNFKHVASTAGWIFFEDLMHFTVLNPNGSRPRWRARTLIVEEGTG